MAETEAMGLPCLVEGVKRDRIEGVPSGWSGLIAGATILSSCPSVYGTPGGCGSPFDRSQSR
jgi:hypothetical protein